MGVMMKEVDIAPQLDQIILTKLGLYCSERLSNDLYYLYEVIELMLPHFNLAEVEKDFDSIHGYGEWEKSYKKFKKTKKLISNSRMFYDSISDKSFLKKSTNLKDGLENQIQKIFKKFFYRNVSQISLIEQRIYNIFVFLINNSSIKRRQIKNEYFKNLEQKDNRKITLDKKGYGS